jgi:hypothetical protein
MGDAMTPTEVELWVEPAAVALALELGHTMESIAPPMRAAPNTRRIAEEVLIASDAIARIRELEAENARLRWALTAACADGWTDGPGAMRAYLRAADAALSNEGGGDVPPL